MAMWTRWGGECKIVAMIGKHRPPYFEHEATLILVKHEPMRDYAAVRFYWAEFLKTDDGWQEIEAALEAAPKIMLSSLMLAAAFKEAE